MTTDRYILATILKEKLQDLAKTAGQGVRELDLVDFFTDLLDHMFDENELRQIHGDIEVLLHNHDNENEEMSRLEQLALEAAAEQERDRWENDPYTDVYYLDDEQ